MTHAARQNYANQRSLRSVSRMLLIGVPARLVALLLREIVLWIVPLLSRYQVERAAKSRDA